MSGGRGAVTGLLVLALGALGACGGAAAVATPGAAPPASPSAAAAPPPHTPQTAALPGLDITLRPDGATGELAVDLVASGPAEALSVLTLGEPGPAALARWMFRDEAGALPVDPASRAERVRFTRPAVGALRVHAVFPAHPDPTGDAARIWVDPDRFEARGEAMLPLPEAFLDTPVPVHLVVETGSLGSAGTRAGSTFGATGDHHFHARGRDLARATFAGGPAGMALFDAPEGHDEALWIGYTSFDPRPIAADVASFRTAVRTVLGDAAAGPSTLLIVSDARRQGAYHVERRSGGLVLHVGAAETWSAPLRITVATAVLQRWLGGELWIGPEGERRGEAVWFTEGVSRFVARDLLFRFGLITPDELRAEVEGQTATLLTSPLAERTQTDLAKDPSRPGVVPLLAARGALYAARVDALLRAKGGEKAGLTALLRELLAEARQKNAALPVRRWTELLTERLGSDAESAYQRFVERGDGAPLPTDILGPCLRGTKRTYAAFSLGFDLRGTLDRPDPRVLRGLDPKGPGARAGLREGDILVSARHEEGRADVHAVVVVQRDGTEKTLRYLPVGKRADGLGFVRTDVPAERCVP